MQDAADDVKKRLLEAALPHVPFDGWSDAAFRAAIADSGVDAAAARSACPRGAVDLALAFHAAGDAEMVHRLGEADLEAMRFRDRVAHAVRLRIEAIPDREAVRRGSALFALPQYAPLGAQAIWGTADAIWTALGDTSEDYNWYTKRATLSGVYASVVLYWLGDDSPEHQGTWAFLDRRIEDVMRIEKAKGAVQGNPLFKAMFALPNWALSHVRAPGASRRRDVPGVFTTPGES